MNDTLDLLETEIAGCRRCPELAETRTRTVPGVFPAGARLVLVGEAPGAQEDESGLPFVGRSGRLLDELLGELGCARSEVAVLNTLKCRPPGNRVPTRVETTSCRPYAEAQLRAVAPALIVTLGLSATRWFLPKVALGKVRGRVHDVLGPDRPWHVLPTYHPSAAIRFGPRGEPRRLLTEDLALALRLAR